jgi:hypothetical protein
LKLNHDFRELLACFDNREVRYLIIGGWALAMHGIVRLTKDLDVWVLPDAVNAEAIMLALSDFGFGELGLTASDFMEPEMVIQLGYPPNRVDLITTPTGVEFNDCWADRIEADMDGLRVPFLGRDGLIANKVATGRPQDLLDVANLEQQDL